MATIVVSISATMHLTAILPRWLTLPNVWHWMFTSCVMTVDVCRREGHQYLVCRSHGRIQSWTSRTKHPGENCSATSLESSALVKFAEFNAPNWMREKIEVHVCSSSKLENQRARRCMPWLTESPTLMSTHLAKKLSRYVFALLRPQDQIFMCFTNILTSS